MAPPPTNKLAGNGRGEIRQVFVRFQDAATGAMAGRSWVIPWQPLAPAFDLLPPTRQLAGLATLFAEHLRRPGTGQLARIEDMDSAGAGTVRSG